eukprot:COSAG04_NODE_1235_length_7625_cov_36.004651_6_plen_91_part_00
MGQEAADSSWLCRAEQEAGAGSRSRKPGRSRKPKQQRWNMALALAPAMAAAAIAAPAHPNIVWFLTVRRPSTPFLPPAISLADASARTAG